MLAFSRLSHSQLLVTRFTISLSSERTMKRRAPKQGKPPILPPSKKVLYNVVHVPWQKVEDVRELLWRRHVYNNAVTSLREVFRSEIAAKAAAGFGILAMREEENKELNVLLEMNEKRNKAKAAERAASEKEEWRVTKHEILTEIEDELNKQRSISKIVEQQVRATIDRSSEFVTHTNLEQKILAALESPTIFDFAIDRNGKKIFNPPPVKYQEGTPTRQKGRLYDKTLGGVVGISENQKDIPVDQLSTP